MNLAGIFLFPYQQIGNQKAAQYKKEIHAQVSVLKESLNVVEGVRTGIFDVIEKGHVRMVQEHQEEGNES